MSAARFSVIPASYVYLVRDGRVLLQRRANTGYLDGMWVAGVAGHVEFGETAAETAVHEAREEIGVALAQCDLRPITVMQRADGTDDPVEQRVDWFFTVERWAGEPRVMEPTKCSAIGWFDLRELPNSVPDYERIVLDGLAAGRVPVFTDFGFGASPTG